MVGSAEILKLLSDGAERTIPEIQEQLGLDDRESLRSQLCYLTGSGSIRRVSRGKYVMDVVEDE